MKMNPLFLFPLLLPVALASANDLRVGFYSSSCPQAESIVQDVVKKHHSTDPTVSAALLRLYFHDCFVTGCDASILIDSRNRSSEKFAMENFTVRGFDLIEKAKSNIEAQCPSVVSCADIIAFAARDAAVLAGGHSYEVPTGRRDGLRSNHSDAATLPAAITALPDGLKQFTDKGFTAEDMVVLLGAHSIGVAHCNLFRHRITICPRATPTDLLMDSSLCDKLNKFCGEFPMPIVEDPQVNFEEKTPTTIDNAYYIGLLENRGLINFDQEMAVNGLTKGIVQNLASDNGGFLKKFADALVKLGKLDVLTGKEGEIRKRCYDFNTPS